jgi:hypothetical protein
MAYKQEPGRRPMMKTGRGIPKELMGPEGAKMGHEGAKMAHGPEFDLIGAAKKVAKRISVAHQRGKDKYYKNWSAADTWGDFGGGGGGRGGSRNYDPTNYVGGFVRGLITGDPKPKGARMYKK